MKFILFLACLALYAAHTQAQQCRGDVSPVRLVCTGGRDDGVGRSRACQGRANNMWYYDSNDRTCKTMTYRGCAGNNNRYCTREACERRCRR